MTSFKNNESECEKCIRLRKEENDEMQRARKLIREIKELLLKADMDKISENWEPIEIETTAGVKMPMEREIKI